MNVVALIVTYNRLDKLKTTIEATLALPFQYIVVVNNASTDDTQSYLDSFCDERIKVLHREVNSGGAGGFKYGARWITENLSSDWVLFYDDDAYPHTDFYDNLIRWQVQQGTVYCCKVLDTENNLCKMNMPWKKYPHGILENIAYLRQPEKFIPNGQSKENVSSVSFVGMLIDIKLLTSSIDYIYDDLFIYFDDVYFSYNLRLNAIPIIYVPELIIIHDVDTRTMPMSYWKLYYLVRNLILSRVLFPKKAPFSRIDILLRVLKYFLIGIKNPDPKKAIGGIIKGISDGVKGRRGQGI
ncbi:glycosyltransferase [Klebsiella aerogenes]|uniref:glycosyltransferase n=1 Tax=Klebsiella aerogenes TaxID=548 RepID=UPI000669AED5|nr:glycosyltransferase [Klebsiella aerogenes]EIW8578652.1 glycosyltransferase [Klebsiella aerogenes]ELA0168430.1 glycosyltransferase [Klebsiella aerogenes]MEB6108015.1 glycosyltransferase [Klebsiella aerogenes]MEB6600280.1 glycosyltransferase [Klebsiella aerogenes]MEB6654768.1 glycosyltransferase [Klebsiella aerogenes]